MRVENLTREEKVGQLFQIGFPGTEPTEEVEELLTEYHVGGVIYGAGYTQQLLERADAAELADEDAVATATRLTATSIADAYDRHVSIDPDRVVLSGGGAHNPTLVAMLEDALDCPVETAGDHGTDPDFREATVFALLAALFDADQPGNLPAVTGA